MAKSKRRPPFGATKKTAIGYSRERAFKNRIHELEQEVLKIANDRQRVVENNVCLNEQLNALHAKQVATVGNIFDKKEVDRMLEEQYQRILIGAVTAIVSGKVSR